MTEYRQHSGPRGLILRFVLELMWDAVYFGNSKKRGGEGCQARRWIKDAVAARGEWAARIVQRHYRARMGRRSFLGTLRRQQNALLLVIEERAALMVQQAWRLKVAWRNIVVQLKEEPVYTSVRSLPPQRQDAGFFPGLSHTILTIAVLLTNRVCLSSRFAFQVPVLPRPRHAEPVLDEPAHARDLLDEAHDHEARGHGRARGARALGVRKNIQDAALLTGLH